MYPISPGQTKKIKLVIVEEDVCYQIEKVYNNDQSSEIYELTTSIDNISIKKLSC